MKRFRLSVLVGAVLLVMTLLLSAIPTPVPPFDQCPTAGMAQSCAYLLVLGPSGSVNLLWDQSVKDVDTQEDILVGILELKDHWDWGEHANDADDDDMQVTPEPGSLALLGTGLVALGVILRRRAVRILSRC